VVGVLLIFCVGVLFFGFVIWYEARSRRREREELFRRIRATRRTVRLG